MMMMMMMNGYPSAAGQVQARESLPVLPLSYTTQGRI